LCKGPGGLIPEEPGALIPAELSRSRVTGPWGTMAGIDWPDCKTRSSDDTLCERSARMPRLKIAVFVVFWEISAASAVFSRETFFSARDGSAWASREVGPLCWASMTEGELRSTTLEDTNRASLAPNRRARTRTVGPRIVQLKKNNQD